MTEAFKIRSNLAGLCETCGDILATTDIKDLNVTPSLIRLGVSIVDSLSEDYVAEGFIERTEKWWPEILSKNEEFWSKHCQSIFPEMPDDYARDFVRILAYEGIRPKDRESAWKLLHGAVRCSIRHIHISRCPRIIKGEMKYTRQYMTQVSLAQTATEWGVVLA